MATTTDLPRLQPAVYRDLPLDEMVCQLCPGPATCLIAFPRPARHGIYWLLQRNFVCAACCDKLLVSIEAWNSHRTE